MPTGLHIAQNVGMHSGTDEYQYNRTFGGGCNRQGILGAHQPGRLAHINMHSHRDGQM